jgi:2-oxoglutarate dehydrogenase E2 component (dihydrolipoamide succinyltransferase)
MGESVAEGTIVRWIKQVGDVVDKDEPLFEISTDKVDAEIPAPEAGVLLEIKVAEGQTVAVNSIVAIIGQAGETAADRPSSTAEAEEVDGTSGVADPASAESRSPAAVASIDDAWRTRSSPVVRRIAAEYAVDLADIDGTGVSGRVTKDDIEKFVLSGRRGQGPREMPRQPVYQHGDNVRIEPMGVMRKKIAEHMVTSARTVPHVYQTFEVDFGRIDELRRAKKAEYEAAGTKLTFTAFVLKATAETLVEFPFANASLDGGNIVYKNDINIGIAVALEQGLIVPVVRNADRRSMFDLCRAVQDLAQRARTKQLSHDDVQGGTFTITNPGTFGAMLGLPIINHPQVAILSVGTVEKRAVVVDDAVVARPTSWVTLGHDHRLIDGAEGGAFLQALKARLQEFDESSM